MSASPCRGSPAPRSDCAANSTDKGRAPKLLQNLGRVNHLTAVSRAREGRGAPRARQQSAPPMPRRATRARRIKLNKTTADQSSLHGFVD